MTLVALQRIKWNHIVYSVKKKKKKIENTDPEVTSTSNGRVMILSKCAICGSKKFRFIKHLEAKGLLSKLDIKSPLSKIPIPSDILT